MQSERVGQLGAAPLSNTIPTERQCTRQQTCIRQTKVHTSHVYVRHTEINAIANQNSVLKDLTQVDTDRYTIRQICR